MDRADPPMIVRTAANGDFVRVNAAFVEDTGLDAEALRATAFIDWINPDERPRFAAALDTREGVYRVHHRTKSGGYIPLEVRVSTRGDDTVVLGRLATPKLDAVDADEDTPKGTVSETLGTIARIVEAQNPGYRCSILLVADGRFVRGAGPSLPEEYNAAIDGFAIGPMVGSCGTAIYWNVPVIVEDIQADPLWVPFAELAKRAGVAACWSHPFTSSNGRVLGALALYAPTPRAPTPEQLSRLQAAAAMTGLAVERGRAEEALREKRKRELELEEQLRQAAKMEALGVLAGGVAHDFNNVLATILGNAEFSLRLLSPQSEVAEMVEDIVAASKRAGDFCKQMLAYAGQGSRTTTRLDIGALVPQLGSLVQAAVSKKATLTYRLCEGPTFVEGDENQLLQVIMNLVTNAADAIGEREGEIVVATDVVEYGSDELARLWPDSGLVAGSYVRVTVRDTGCGMDTETLERMFDPFFTTKFTGRGLGLAAVRGIVRAHRGTIQIDSEVGVGTTVTVILPAAESSQAKNTATAHRPAAGARRRVLVADDEPRFRSILIRQLRHHDFEVVEAADGQQALEVFASDPDSFDAVLLDLSMPKRNGDEVLRGIRAARSSTPVILMSGFAEEGLLDRLQGAEFVGFLQKPIASADLFTMLDKATTVSAAPHLATG